MNNIITKLENFQKFNSLPLHIDIISPTETIEPHYHDCVEMIFVKTGRAMHCIDSSPFNYRRGHLFLVSGQVSHSLFGFENFSAYRLLFDMSIFDNFPEELKNTHGFIALFVMSNISASDIHFHSVMTLDENYILQLFSLFDKLLCAYETDGVSEDDIKQMFFDAVELILQQFNERSQTKSYYYPMLTRTFFENINEPLSVSELAEKFQISSNYLYKLFKKRFDKSPKQLMKDIRIRNAKMLLALTDKSITEIAASCGFSNPVYFAEVFKSYESITPSQYRKKHKKGDV